MANSIRYKCKLSSYLSSMIDLQFHLQKILLKLQLKIDIESLELGVGKSAHLDKTVHRVQRIPNF